MREGEMLVGWGMASGTYDALQVPASARCALTSDGKLTVSSATADIGTGTYTIMTQIAAELMGLPIEDVTFELGDSSLPSAPVEGDSFTAASVGSAVKAACDGVTTAHARAKIDNHCQGAPDDGSLPERRDPARNARQSFSFAMRAPPSGVIRAEAQGALGLGALLDYSHSAGSLGCASMRTSARSGQVVKRAVRRVHSEPDDGTQPDPRGVVWGHRNGARRERYRSTVRAFHQPQLRGVSRSGECRHP
jgi:xanthine dehydrogenase YagR molybdenum-binding subunit